MKRIFLLIVLALLLSVRRHAFAQSGPSPADCSKFRTGTFTFTLESGQTIKMVRTATAQKEYYDDGSIDLKVNWVSDCQYNLNILNIPDITKKELIGKVLKVTITRVEGNAYYYSASMDGYDLVVNNKVTKIK